MTKKEFNEQTKDMPPETVLMAFDEDSRVLEPVVDLVLEHNPPTIEFCTDGTDSEDDEDDEPKSKLESTVINYHRGDMTEMDRAELGYSDDAIEQFPTLHQSTTGWDSIETRILPPEADYAYVIYFTPGPDDSAPSFTYLVSDYGDLVDLWGKLARIEVDMHLAVQARI